MKAMKKIEKIWLVGALASLGIGACSDPLPGDDAAGGSDASGGTESAGGSKATGGGQTTGGAQASGGSTASGGKATAGEGGANLGGEVGTGGAAQCEPPTDIGGFGGEAGEPAGDGAPEIVGTYADKWGGDHLVTATLWDQGSLFHIAYVDNNEHFLIAQNDSDNVYYPGLWSRFSWTQHDGELFMCQDVYAGDSFDETFCASLPNASDPASSGCGPFYWSILTPAP